MKARKKPVEINYHIWDGDYIELVNWLGNMDDLIKDHFIVSQLGFENEIWVRTLEGDSYKVPHGYVIIRGVEGEYYPCDPIIFDKTYDKIN
jgi:hypothetical protein